MPQSSCLCGNIKLSFSSEGGFPFRCHCHDDRKITGSLFATNLMVPESSLTLLQGTPKTYGKTVESGNWMVSYFCGDCGSTLYRKSSGIAGQVVMKVGCVDGDDDTSDEDVKHFLEDGGARPQMEMFVRSRVPWQPGFEGATQIEGVFLP